MELVDRTHVAVNFADVDEPAYPLDLAVFARYYFDLNVKLRYPKPSSITLNELYDFLAETQERHQVQWL